MRFFKVWVSGEVAADIKAETLLHATEIARKAYQDKTVRVEPCQKQN